MYTPRRPSSLIPSHQHTLSLAFFFALTLLLALPFSGQWPVPQPDQGTWPWAGRGPDGAPRPGLDSSVRPEQTVPQPPRPTVTVPPTPPTDAPTNPAFMAVWERTDRAVQRGQTNRSWLWGPQPLNTLQEPYSDSPGGQRQVQYFDKSRMEINNPAANAVTNGLLATELIKGELQVGDTPRETKEPALVNVAGDSDDLDGPVYASLTGLLDQPAAPVGSTLIETLNRDGSTGD